MWAVRGAYASKEVTHEVTGAAGEIVLNRADHGRTWPSASYFSPTPDLVGFTPSS